MHLLPRFRTIRSSATDVTDEDDAETKGVVYFVSWLGFTVEVGFHRIVRGIRSPVRS